MKQIAVCLIKSVLYQSGDELINKSAHQLLLKQNSDNIDMLIFVNPVHR